MLRNIDRHKVLVFQLAVVVMLSACASSHNVSERQPLQCAVGEQVICTGNSAWHVGDEQKGNCSCQRMRNLSQIY